MGFFDAFKPRGSAAPGTEKPQPSMGKFRAELAEVKKIPEQPHKEKGPTAASRQERLSPRMKALEKQIDGLEEAIKDIKDAIDNLLKTNARVPADQVIEGLRREIADLERERKKLEGKITEVTREDIEKEEKIKPASDTRLSFYHPEVPSAVRGGPRSIVFDIQGPPDLMLLLSDINKIRAEGVLKYLRESDKATAAIEFEALEKSEREVAGRLSELRDTIFTRAIDNEVRELLPRGMTVRSVDDLLRKSVAQEVAQILKRTVGYDAKKYLRDVAEYREVRNELRALTDLNHQISETLKDKGEEHPLHTPGEIYPGARSTLARRQGAGEVTQTGIAGSAAQMERRGAVSTMGAPAMERAELEKTADESAEETTQRVSELLSTMEAIDEDVKASPTTAAETLRGLPVDYSSDPKEPSFRDRLNRLYDELDALEYGYGQTDEGKTHLDLIRADISKGFDLIHSLSQAQQETLRSKGTMVQKKWERRAPEQPASPMRTGVGGFHEDGLDIGSLVQDLRDLSAQAIAKDVKKGAELNDELRRLNAEKTAKELFDLLSQLRDSLFSRPIDDEVKDTLTVAKFKIPSSIEELAPVASAKKGKPAVDNPLAVKIADILKKTTGRNPDEYLSGIRQYFESAKEAAPVFLDDSITQSMKSWKDLAHRLETAATISPEDLDPSLGARELVNLQAWQEKFEDLALPPSSEIGQHLERKFTAAETILQDLEKTISVKRYRHENSARIAKTMEFFGQATATRLWGVINKKFEGLRAPESNKDLAEASRTLGNVAELATEYVLLLAEVKQGDGTKEDQRKVDRLNRILGISDMQLNEILRQEERAKPASAAVRKGSKK